MRYMARPELEQIALRVLRAYRKLPEAQEDPYRVDPVLLAKGLLGLTVRYRHLSEDRELMGLTSYGELELVLPDEDRCGTCLLDGKTVLLEEDLLYQPAGLGRRNFTLSHECAHHILKLLFPESYGAGPAARRALPCRLHRLHARGSRQDWEEWQMDVLASELLMPRELLRKNLALVGCPEGFRVLNPNWRRRDYGRFTGLCAMMGVSKQAMAYRLELLGLLGKNQMYCPDIIIDIFMEEEETI